MKSLFRAFAFGVVAAWSIETVVAELPTGSDPMAECHKVFSEVGLVIRTGPSSDAKKIGSLQKGARVKLDGEILKGTGAVYPMIQDGPDGSLWIKLKAPKAGYVLLASEDDPDYRYLVPCEE